MPSSITKCPACKTLLLKDTVQCPACSHVLDQERYAQIGDEERSVDRSSSAGEDPCPLCGAMVRRGLVRCWNCGSFMREDIATMYQQMQERPAPVIYSDPPNKDREEPSYREDDKGPIYQMEEAGGAGGDDDDFELSGDVQAEIARAAPLGSQSSEADDAGDRLLPPGAAGHSEDNGAGPSTAENKEQDGGDEQAEKEHSGESGEEQSEQDDENAEPHSVATGGDVLLQVALEEESETEKRRAHGSRRRRKSRGATGGFLIYCPNGHRIEVHDRHRGKAGRCPRCRAVFIVPEKFPTEEEQTAAETSSEQTEAEQTSEDSTVAGVYQRWMNDVCFHTLNPEKLRLRSGSLQKDFQPVDFGFGPDGLLLVVLAQPGGLFGVGGKDRETVRQELFEGLRQEVPLNDLPAHETSLFDPEALQRLSVVQPFHDDDESMFAGVPVFGEGRIAVRFPKTEQGQLPRFASFSLSEFREFSKNLSELYGIEGLGAGLDIPFEDDYGDHTCHYSEQTFQALDPDRLGYYEADPALTLKTVGRKCESCGLVVSEDSRKKEKIGGASGRGIARAKCPKCGQKFGSTTLYALEQAPGSQEASAEAPESDGSQSPQDESAQPDS